MFLPASVCLSARLLKSLWKDFDEIFRRGGAWPKNQSKPTDAEHPRIQNFLKVLQGVSKACYAEPCISYGREVCPSVTRWHGVKITQARNTKSSLWDSPRTLVFGIKSSTRNSERFSPSEGVKWEGVGKICNFQPISRCISETLQDMTKVTINNK